MATVQSKIEEIIQWYYTSTWQFPLTEGLLRFQEADNDIRNKIITRVWEDYYWDILYTDTVTNQDEYNVSRVEILNDVWVDILKLKRLWIKYEWDTRFKEVKPIDGDYFSYDYDYLKVNQPKSDPVFFRKDNSVFIYPAETTTETYLDSWWSTVQWLQDGLKLGVILWGRTLTLSTELIDSDWKNNLAVKSQFYHLYDLYLGRYIYKKQNKLNEASLIISEYDKSMDEMLSILTDQIDLVIEETLPNTKSFE